MLAIACHSCIVGVQRLSATGGGTMARAIKPVLIVLAAIALTVFVAACHYHGHTLVTGMHFYA